MSILGGGLPPHLQQLLQNSSLEIEGIKISLAPLAGKPVQLMDASEKLIAIHEMLMETGEFQDTDHIQFSRDPEQVVMNASILINAWYSGLKNGWYEVMERLAALEEISHNGSTPELRDAVQKLCKDRGLAIEAALKHKKARNDRLQLQEPG